DESSSSDDAGASDEGNALPGDLELDANASETRDLHRSRIAAGMLSTCAVVQDGTVRCWGGNIFGELGNGTGLDSTTPVVAAGLTDIVALDAGYRTYVALRSNGTVYRWGPRWGAAGDPIDTTPQLVAGLSDIVAIGAEYKSTCAVRSDGRTFCWGDGVLGDGDASKASSTPVQVTGIDTAVATNGSCVLLANGTVKCWGGNLSGQLGNGTNVASNVPVAVQGLAGAVAISGSFGTNYAVLADGTARSWGSNHFGVLGDGGTAPSNTPVALLGIANAGDISGAFYPSMGSELSACVALRDGGTVRCFGMNMHGQLGLGSTDFDAHATPAEVPGLDGVVDVSTNGRHACALRSDGSVRCWGDNSYGQLGDGTTTHRFSPVDVSGLSAVNEGPQVATGMYHGCGLRSDGTVKCWGDNSEGQIGDGTQIDRTSATLVGGLSNVTDVAAGGRHTCALVDDSTVRCWGRNASGELGDDSASGVRSTAPVVVYALDIVTQLAAGDGSTCALRSDGTVACWGSNVYGQLGDGFNTSADVPVLVSGMSDAIAIDGSRYHYCALRAGGQVKCWGSNVNGQLGNGSAGAGANSNVPVTVKSSTLLNPALANVVGISAGHNHSCAAIAGGTARCWGAGGGGALGQGAWSSSNYAVAVSGLTNAVDISAGGSSSCAVRSNGSARCWGSNDYGELGNGDDTATHTPVAVGMNPIWLSNAIDIDSGYDHTCVAKGNGTIWCWGLNNNGQLGNGGTFDSELPVGVASFP
ncbi:MAG TPA: hypothetical protein VG755_38180, partial [Nannocystaceae bacterium]|nr:hypothetical protein [Nannocystaceae bacterium]